MDQPFVERRLSDRCVETGTATCEMLQDMESRMDNKLILSNERLKRVEDKLDENNAATNENNAALAEVLDILRLGKAFFRLAGYVGKFAKWATAIGTPLAAAWYALRGAK